MERNRCTSSHYTDWRGRVFAWLLERAAGRHESLLAERRHQMLGGLSGTVLEIGPGTGVNLSFYPRTIRWIGIEPNPYMHKYLRRRAASLGIAVDLRRDMAEQIGLEPGSVDIVVSTLVLCSVADLGAVLGQVHRVLKPGGRFVFLEHTAAPAGTWLRRLQRVLRPLWRTMASGCRPDRDIAAVLRNAGFARIDMESFRVKAPVISPHIAGVAVK